MEIFEIADRLAGNGIFQLSIPKEVRPFGGCSLPLLIYSVRKAGMIGALHISLCKFRADEQQKMTAAAEKSC